MRGALLAIVCAGYLASVWMAAAAILIVVGLGTDALIRMAIGGGM